MTNLQRKRLHPRRKPLQRKTVMMMKKEMKMMMKMKMKKAKRKKEPTPLRKNPPSHQSGRRWMTPPPSPTPTPLL